MLSWSYLRLLGIFFCAAMVACGTAFGSILLVIVGFVVSLPVVYVAGKKSKEVGETIEDERTLDISRRSALLTYTLVVPGMGIGAAFLIAVSDGSGWMYNSGQTLALSTLALMFVFIATYLIIDRGMKKDG
ncbi:MAG: DUF2178 domain-containing protein [Candidatus Methanoplasma sp.]|jgi:uncharacterized membrane protein|nr:DUF2178 domain-containing protein [Candidatus Methanoplasma sp.]